jgi:hypothetical protein
MRFTLPKLFLVVSLAALACAGMFSPIFGLTCTIVSVTIAMFLLTAIRAIKLAGSDRVFAITFALVGAGYLFVVTSFVTRNLARTLITNYPIAMFAVAQDRAPRIYPVLPTTYFPPPAYTGPAYSTPAAAQPTIPAQSTNGSSPASGGGTVTVSPMLPAATSGQVNTFTVTMPNGTQVSSSAPMPVAQTSLPWETIIGAGLSDDDDKGPLTRTFLIGHCVWSWLIALLAGWFAGRMYSQRSNSVSLKPID